MPHRTRHTPHAPGTPFNPNTDEILTPRCPFCAAPMEYEGDNMWACLNVIVHPEKMEVSVRLDEPEKGWHMPNRARIAAVQVLFLVFLLIVLGLLLVAIMHAIDRRTLTNTKSEIRGDAASFALILREIEPDRNEWRTWPRRGSQVLADNGCVTDGCLKRRQMIVDYKLQEEAEIAADRAEGRQR